MVGNRTKANRHEQLSNGMEGFKIKAKLKYLCYVRQSGTTQRSVIVCAPPISLQKAVEFTDDE